MFLTVLTQIGGLIYLLSFFTHGFINKRLSSAISRTTVEFGSFVILYTLATFLIVPKIAPSFGRVSLPLTESDHLKPLNFLTCFLNRNYVQPELKEAVSKVSKQIAKKHPGTVVNYLDASFPFINGFPLLPHLSHNDGRKLDIAFCYIDKKTGEETNSVPSVIGYGVSEDARPNEMNTAKLCAAKGNWQYTLLSKIVPQGNKQEFIFDSTRTKELVSLLASAPKIEKIFIEPHLKARLKLQSNKIRFHGCGAVQHDDHIHVQMK